MTIRADLEIDSFEDILEYTAQIVLSQQQHLLPNLQSIKVVFPNDNVCSEFRNRLLGQLPDSFKGIIPPWTGTLKNYLFSLSHTDGLDTRLISNESRRLLFIETLDAHPKLYNDENKWQVTSSLLSLFDELYLSNPDILNSTAEDWIATLKTAYNIKSDIKNLRDEAALVQTLWIAWQEQLDASNLIDPTREYINKLVSAGQANDSDYIYFVTTADYSPAENAFIENIRSKNRGFVLQFSNNPPEKRNPVFDFVNGTFNFQTPLIERVNHISLENSKPHFSFFPANNDESEACAVDLQIRKWLLSGKTNIGIICENRKMSRRIRALLERADIHLQDLSGWSLATTSAAAVLESWLQCIEEDFDHNALLDLLKSHFFLSSTTREFHTQAVYRLEHDIILHENISSNINRYKKQLKYRANRLTHWPADTYSHVEQLLDTLGEISTPLTTLFSSKQKYPLSKFVSEFLITLEQLGITKSFSSDDAGITILRTLDGMKNGLTHSDPEMKWNDFRTWLGINMEDKLFKPHVESSPVSLLTLEQSELMRFDGLIIASADKQYFPGSADNSPFFNQSVRTSLMLTDWKIKHEQRLAQFKMLLFSSDDILISYKHEDKGESIPLSPWVTALQNCYHLICKKSLSDDDLINELKGDTSVSIYDDIKLPDLSRQPSTVIPEELIPPKYSARSHQSLIDCPYKYFIEDALLLKAPEEISDELQKSDYGRLIHRILQTFHLHTNDKIEPFGEVLTQHNKVAATEYLIKISTQLFQHDLEINALHKSWLHRWLKQIPGYIDWQIDHQQNWNIAEAEKVLSIELENNKVLFGRIDRIDTNIDNGEKLIIDYKTGRSANQASVDNAEDVQLITYALLNNDVDNVFYLSLDDSKGGVKQAASLSGESLQSLKLACTARLNELITMTHDGHSFTAWGDDNVCSYCRFDGICRKPFWAEQ